MSGVSCEADRVDVTALREAFERSSITAGELARLLGWMKPDVGRVSRQLGLAPTSNGRGQIQTRETVSRERAWEIAEALGVDPVDVGL